MRYVFAPDGKKLPVAETLAMARDVAERTHRTPVERGLAISLVAALEALQSFDEDDRPHRLVDFERKGGWLHRPAHRALCACGWVSEWVGVDESVRLIFLLRNHEQEVTR